MKPTLDRFLGMVVVMLLTGCGTVAVPTNPNSFDVPVGTAAGLRIPNTVSLKNAYPTETVVKVNNTTPAWSSDLRQLTDTAIAMLTRAMAKQGVHLAPQAEKSVTLRVHSVHATLGGIRIAPRGEARLVLDATYLDGSSTSVDALNTAWYSGQNAVDGAVMLAVSDLLRHPKFLAYVNQIETTSDTPTPATRFHETARQPVAPVTGRIQHIRDLEGTWTGRGRTPGNPWVPLTMILRADGSYESFTPSTRFEGSYWIADGKARYRSTTTGRTGTFELRERDGQRLLIIIIDGGGEAELKPASR